MMKKIQKAGKKAVNQLARQNLSPAQFQLASAAIAVAKQTKKKRKNKNQGSSSSSNIPVKMETYSTTYSRKEVRESYKFTLITGLVGGASSAMRMFLTPDSTGVTLTNAFGGWDPKLSLDAQKYREFRVDSAKLIYNGGLASTTTGTVFFGSSRDPNISAPLSSEFSYIEKNGKCGVTAPYQFPLVHDRDFHTIATNQNWAALSPADRKVLCAGVADMTNIFNTISAADSAGFRMDLELNLTYRGLNPNFVGASQNYISFPLSNSPAPERFATNVARFTEDNTYLYFPLNMGWNRVLALMNYDATTDLTVVSRSGAFVYADRYRFLLYNNGADDMRVFTGNGTAITARRTVPGTPANFSTFLLFAYCESGDTLRVTKDFRTEVSASASACYVDIAKADGQDVLKLGQSWDPNFSLSNLPII